MCAYVCARMPMMDFCPIQVVFLHHAQYSRDRLWNHSYHNQDRAHTEDERVICFQFGLIFFSPIYNMSLSEKVHVKYSHRCNEHEPGELFTLFLFFEMLCVHVCGIVYHIT